MTQDEGKRAIEIAHKAYMDVSLEGRREDPLTAAIRAYLEALSPGWELIRRHPSGAFQRLPPPGLEPADD